MASRAFPDTETRQIKRTADGHFTVEALATLAKETSLCRHCGRDVCGLRRALNDAAAARALYGVRACADFVPVLSFSVVDGLELPRWNTVRLGKAWAERLEPGFQVAIADMRRRAIVRRMRVVETVVMPLEELVDLHAAQNHVILADPELELGEAPKRLMRIIRNAYGSTYADGGRMATAIYLEGT